MIRRRLLIVSAVVATFVLTACADATGPSKTCQVVGGSNVCEGQ
jgi:predicted small secreted protein